MPEGKQELREVRLSWFAMGRSKLDELSASTHHRRSSAPKIDLLGSMTSHDRFAVRRTSMRTAETEFKGAHEAVKGSLAAIASYLQKFDVPQERFDKTNHCIRRLQYVEAMEQYQAMMRQRLLTDEEDSVESRILLVLNAWQALCRYTSIRYRRARKVVFQMRHEFSSPTSPKRIQKALVLQVDAAEQNVACQKGLYLTQQWHKQFEYRVLHRSSMSDRRRARQ